MKHGSLFSGIGGFDLAAQWMGWENVFHCEWNEFGRKVLNYYWPEATSYEDITKTDFNIYRGKIDILTGGFPCQPYSTAGKRLGKEDDRHLWPEMLRAIREIQPGYVVAENVLGLVNWNGGLVFHEVQVDLEAEGYEVQPYVLPACAIGAPHRRDRVWFVAYSGRFNKRREEKPKRTSNNTTRCCLRTNKGSEKDIIQRLIPNTDSDGQQWDKESTKRCGSERQHVKGQREREFRGRNSQTIANTNGRRQSSKEYREAESGRITKESIPDNWENFPTQPPICDGDDGLSARLDGITFPKWRNESIKAGGNAIVPQVALQIFKAIELIENNG